MKKVSVYIVLILSFFVISHEALCTLTKEDIYLISSRDALIKQPLEGFKPRSNSKPWPLKLPVDWGGDPFNDRNWRFQLNAWRMTDPILQEYFFTKDAALLQEAFAFVEDWYDYHYVNKRPNKFKWHNMATGIRAMRLAFFLDLLQNNILKLSDESKKKLDALVNIHINRLKDEKHVKISNFGLFQMAGLNLLCKVGSRNPACTGVENFIRKKSSEIIKYEFTEQGVHTENSPYYHYFVIYKILMKFSVFNSIEYVKNIIEKGKRAFQWMIFPNNAIARVGDSEGINKNIPKLSVQDNEQYCFEKDRCYLVGDYSKSGYAIIRSIPNEKNQSMLFVTGMAHNMSHKHSDELSFELYEFDRFIFIDSGKYAYQKDKMRSYMRSVKAHNTISLLNRNIPIRSVKLSGTLLKSIKKESREFKISGTVKRKLYFIQERNIYYDPSHYIRIEDIVTSSRKNNYISSLHLAPDLDPKITEEGFTVKFEEGLITAKVSKGCTASKVRGQKEPLLGWFSPSYFKTVPTTVVRATCPGRRVKIVWDIVFKHDPKTN